MLFVALFVPIVTHAASFDCSKAATHVEKWICSNDELSLLDNALAAEYQIATASAEPDSQLKRDQRRWLTQRNACRNSACVASAYEVRLLQLRAITCTRDLASGACAEGPPQKLPRTADGRLLLLDRYECRIGFGDSGKGKGQDEAIRIQADCIEAGIYDPCEDAGGKWGEAQCAWANMEVAERRIHRATNRLIASSARSKQSGDLSSELAASQQRWLAARDTSCRERNERYFAYEQSSDGDELPPDDAEKLGFCFRRLAEERAEDLEYFSDQVTASNSRLERTRLLEFLRDEPLVRAAQPIR
jgi:uncharacterized protein YecT (DUF1311 family)